VGAVLLAGGQGTRLGFDKPKGMFNIGVTRTLSIFEQQMNNIKDVTKLTGVNFPLFIMTSIKNDEDTRKFFAENNYFGYPKDRVFFFVQKTEPACDFNGKVYLEEKNRVSLSPNGNGGWYSSLMESDCRKVVEGEGIEWLNIYAVDNVLQRICDPQFIGATLLSGVNCGAKVVKKACASEKVGVLCKQGQKPSIVEYYEMPDNLKELTDENGELMYRFGVILNYLFNVKKLNEIVNSKLPYHLAQKAVPHMENGEKVKPDAPCGYKFETLVVDMVKLMDTCLAYEVERSKEFAPVKNKEGVDSVVTARSLLTQNGVKL
jgi:UDP-N-acetylglucosamine/UDP-N-acetylgalactosamine diphosphorylase